ncbi:MAG: hypothetical protein LBR32_09740 [Propionibacteriaceae bacterium]|jgi:uroporphyrinogen decarboxylase|nr:hypothetical protein [Propionibacteriaceae bacterium]
MSRLDSFRAILAGHGDVPYLTAAWQHFVGYEYDRQAFAGATADFVRRWDWDWVKINPRAVYHSEVWGSVYDPDTYDGVVPRLVRPAVASPDDLSGIRALDPLGNSVLAEQLAAARLVKQEFPDRAVLQTLFSPLSTVLQLAGLPLYPGGVTEGYQAPFAKEDLLTRHQTALNNALGNVADTFAEYVKALLAPVADGGAGLDGIFYAVTGTASDGFLDRADFDAFSRRYDRRVLDAARDGQVVFHTCRADSHPDWFTGLPVDAIQWDQFLPGNPPITADLGGATPVGGVNWELFAPGADLGEVARQAEATIRARTGRPFLLAPSCTIPTPASDEALRVLREAN